MHAYDRMYGNSLAKNTVYTVYIHMSYGFGQPKIIHLIAFPMLRPALLLSAYYNGDNCTELSHIYTHTQTHTYFTHTLHTLALTHAHTHTHSHTHVHIHAQAGTHSDGQD
jgi:hypothetical protein